MKTEAVAGLTTFITMAFIVLIAPVILGKAGMPPGDVAVATCLVTAIATIAMGLGANVPLALAPGTGLMVYFSYTVVQQMQVPWPVALGYVFLSGIAFLVLTLLGLREKIIAAVPAHLFCAVSGGIGLFIGLIGFKESGFIVGNPDTLVALGNLRAPDACLALFALLLMAGLAARGIRAAVLIGVLCTTGIAAVLGRVTVPLYQPHRIVDLGTLAFRFDLPGAVGRGGHGLGLLEIVFVFLFVDLFDNLATLMAVTRRAGLVDDSGRPPRLNRILMIDSVATIAAACIGTSTVTTYAESVAGVQAGGRTGLTSVFTGLLFLMTMFVASYASVIPMAATAPALIVVGAMMMVPIAEVAWSNPAHAVPSFLTVALIPLTFSIANGLPAGVITHVFMRLMSGDLTRKDIPSGILAIIFVVRFVVAPVA